MSDWVILRTSGRNTLPLAESLRNERFDTWAPSTKIQLPRRRVRVLAALLPTYVFAKARHLTDLIELSASPQNPHPAFSVFHYLDRIPLVADAELAALRAVERRTAPRETALVFYPGDEVFAHDGAWAGLPGVVQCSDGKFVMVLFGRMSVKIATFRLHPGERQAA